MPLKDSQEVRDKLQQLRELEDEEAALITGPRLAGARERRARISFSDFCERVIRDENSDELIKLSAIHKSWIDHITWCWANGLHSCVMAPFGHGKCRLKNSRITMADGSYKFIQDIQNEMVLAFDDKSFQFRTGCARSAYNGHKTVLNLILQSGRSVTATLNHPFLTIDGWKETQELCVDDFVAVARLTPELGKEKLRSGEAALLGFLVGDGSTCASIKFTNKDGALRCLVQKLAAGLGFVSKEHFPEQRCPNISFRKSTGWLRRHGLLGCTSYTKKTPPKIFTAPNFDIAEYLGAYFTCDGTVQSFRGGVIELYSVSHSLLRDVQSLLTRFGIVSYVRAKRGCYKNKPHLSWRLCVTGADNLRKFRNAIPLWGIKKQRLQKLCLAASSSLGKDGRRKQYASENQDGIPVGYRKYLKKTAWWHKQHTGVSLDQQSKHVTTRSVVQAAAEAEQNSYLLSITSDNILWDRIVHIEHLGKQETWSLEVDNFHTFVSDDIINHNTAIFGVALPLWLVGIDSTLRIKLYCANDGLARERLGLIRQYIEESEDYHKVFPQVKPHPKKPWSASRLYLNRATKAKDASLQALGALSSGIGGRCDFNLFDDLNDAKNTLVEPKRREQINQNYRSVFMSRLDPTHGLASMICTKWHDKDLPGSIIADEDMRNNYGFLIQRISEDFEHIDCEYLLGPPRKHKAKSEIVKTLQQFTKEVPYNDSYSSA